MRDAQRLVNQDRNVFGACMVALGHADGMVTGVTRNYATVLEDVLRVIDPARGEQPMGMSIVLSRGRTLFVADTAVAEFPGAPELAQIVIQAAAMARQFGATPRVALVSASTFGNPKMERSEKIRDAVSILDRREDTEFEYEGEMSVDVALNPDMRELYPFSRLSEPANVLVMPAIHSASISTSLLATAGGATVIGPVLTGLSQPIQIAPLGRRGVGHRHVRHAGGVPSRVEQAAKAKPAPALLWPHWLAAASAASQRWQTPTRRCRSRPNR